MKIEIKHYSKLSLDEFHDCIALRIEVFSVEQEVFYNDVDGYDKDSFHFMGKNSEGEIIATARILKPKSKYEQASFGRVVIAKKYRGKGFGHDMVNSLNQFCNQNFDTAGIKISAMLYLKKFYEDHGYKQTSDVYPDCGIDHIDMEFSVK